ncbi:MAG: zinc finger domain-containing protein, partial [Candidatus Methylomirabilis sp.]
TEAAGKKVEARVRRAKGRKCARCWTFSEGVGRTAGFTEVCARCAAVLEEIGYRG